MTTDPAMGGSLDRVAIPGSRPAPPTAPSPGRPPELAGLGQRFLGRILTGAVPTLLALGAVVLSGGGHLLLGALFLLASFGYAIWSTVRLGQTGANRARDLVGIRVVDALTLQPVGIGRALTREWVPALLSGLTCGIFGFVDLVVGASSSSRQCLHDRFAGTMVFVADSVPQAGPSPAQPSPQVAAPARSAPAPAPVPAAAPVPPGPQTAAVDRSGGLISGIPGALPTAPPTGAAPHSPPPAPEPVPDRIDTATRARPPRAAEADAGVPRPGTAVRLLLDDGSEIPPGALTLVGRDPSGDPGAALLAVPDPGRSLSKTHAAFGLEASSTWVEDRGSTNGVTLVRDGVEAVLEAFERTALKPGDHVFLGDRQVTVEGAAPGGVLPIDVPSWRP